MNFSQSSYGQAMLVSPIDPATVWFGGVGLYKSSGSFGHAWNFIAGNGGVHAFQHAMVWDPTSNQILVGNDGGLFMFDPTSNAPNFVSLNHSINASLIQSIGPHPTLNKLIAGFQSNGVQLYNGSVSNWFNPDSESGDGGFALYDKNDPNFVYHDFSLDQVNHAELPFQRLRDRGGHGLGTGARQARGDLDGREIDLRQRRHREQGIGDEADEQDARHQQRGCDGVADERRRDALAGWFAHG